MAKTILFKAIANANWRIVFIFLIWQHIVKGQSILISQHSRKPEQFFELLEKLCQNMTKLEMFARSSRDGWDCWGDEADKYLNIYSLSKLTRKWITYV